MRPSIKIGVQPGTKVFRVERNKAKCDREPCTHVNERWCASAEFCTNEPGSWCIWINPSHDFMHGTYLKLYDNGACERVTLHPDGTETVWEIKPEDM